MRAVAVLLAVLALLAVGEATRNGSMEEEWDMMTEEDAMEGGAYDTAYDDEGDDEMEDEEGEGAADDNEEEEEEEEQEAKKHARHSSPVPARLKARRKRAAAVASPYYHRPGDTRPSQGMLARQFGGAAHHHSVLEHAELARVESLARYRHLLEQPRAAEPLRLLQQLPPEEQEQMAQDMTDACKEWFKMDFVNDFAPPFLSAATPKINRALLAELVPALNKELNEGVSGGAPDEIVNAIMSADDEEGAEDDTEKLSPKKLSKYISEALANTLHASLAHRLTHSVGFNAFNTLTKKLTRALTVTMTGTLTATLMPVVTGNYRKFDYKKFDKCFYEYYKCHYVNQMEDCEMPEECDMYMDDTKAADQSENIGPHLQKNDGFKMPVNLEKRPSYVG